MPFPWKGCMERECEWERERVTSFIGITHEVLISVLSQWVFEERAKAEIGIAPTLDTKSLKLSVKQEEVFLRHDRDIAL